MQAIRTIIWVVIAVVLTIFAAMNFEPVTVRILPGNPGTVAEMPLALLIVFVALASFLPPFLFNLGNRWRLTRKIQSLEDANARLRSAMTPTVVTPAPTAPIAAAPVPAATPLDTGQLL